MLLYPSSTNKPVTIDHLSQLPEPQPMGRFHNPTPFADFVGEIGNSLDRHNISVGESEIVTTNENKNGEGQRMFGAMRIFGVGENAKEFSVVLAFRSSYDQSIKKGLAIGTSVMCCSNLCFSGDLGTWHTKHTTNSALRVKDMIDSAILKLPDAGAREVVRIEKYKSVEILPRTGDTALVHLYKNKALSASQLGTAINEWHKPSHEEHKLNGFSIFRLLNACTESIKPNGTTSNPFTIEAKTRAQTAFLDQVVDKGFSTAITTIH
jgi:hypothetical protein